MKIAWIFILLALAQYIYFVGRTGFSRGKFGIKPPNMTGHEVWERYLRVQLNTLEQLIVFVPALLAFAQFISPKWVCIPGAIFVFARQYYSYLYIKDPMSRTPAFALTFFTNIGLVVSSLVGIAISLFQ